MNEFSEFLFVDQIGFALYINTSPYHFFQFVNRLKMEVS